MSNSSRNRRNKNSRKDPRKKTLAAFFVCVECGGTFQKVLLRARPIDGVRVCVRCYEREKK